MKICIEKVEGGFSVYADSAAPMGQPMPGAAPQDPAAAGADGAQTVATVDEALQLAGSMLGGDAGQAPAQDDASAESLFQSGFTSAAKQ